MGATDTPTDQDKQRFNVPGPLGDYVVLTKLNRGGMADVYLAHEHAPSGPRWIALKTLLPKLGGHRKYVDMFLSESRLGLMLQHPNIVSTLDVGHAELPSGPVHLLTMEYVHGRDLGAVARTFQRSGSGRMPIGQALYVVEAMLKGLGFAHDLSDPSGMPLHLVNRDVSPPNVMVGFDGSVKLIDFGIAQATMDYRSQIGSIKGKLSYMSPEQVRGLPVDRRSDLFSVAVVLYQLITGVEPFAGESEFEQMERVRRAEVQPASSLNRSVSARLDALLERGMARDANDRYQDAEAMLEDLHAVQAELRQPYRAEDMSDFMFNLFSSDLEMLQGRIQQAHALLREGLDAGGRAWVPALGMSAVEGALPKVRRALEETPELPGVDLSAPAPSSPAAKLPTPPTSPSLTRPEVGAPAVPPSPSPKTTAPAQAPAAPASDAPPAWTKPLLIVLGVAIVVLVLIVVVRLVT